MGDMKLQLFFLFAIFAAIFARPHVHCTGPEGTHDHNRCHHEDDHAVATINDNFDDHEDDHAVATKNNNFDDHEDDHAVATINNNFDDLVDAQHDEECIGPESEHDHEKCHHR